MNDLISRHSIISRLFILLGAIAEHFHAIYVCVIMTNHVSVIVTKCPRQCVIVCSFFEGPKSDWYPLCPHINICLCVHE